MRRSYADARIDVSECSTTPQIVVRSSCVHARRLLSYDMAGRCRSAPVVLAHRGLLSAGQGVVVGRQLQLCSRMARLLPRLGASASSGQLQLCSRTACPSCLSGRYRVGQLQLCSRTAASPLLVVSAATSRQDQLCSRMAASPLWVVWAAARVRTSCVRASRSPFGWSGRCRRRSAPVVFAHGGVSSPCGVGCDSSSGPVVFAHGLSFLLIGPVSGRSAPVVLAHGGLSSARGVGCDRASGPVVLAHGLAPLCWWVRFRAGSAPVVFAHGGPPSVRLGSGCRWVGGRGSAAGERRGTRSARCMPVSRRRHDRPPTSRASWPVHAARCVAGRAGAPPSPAGGTSSA
jgi:hypothetical protein